MTNQNAPLSPTALRLSIVILIALCAVLLRGAVERNLREDEAIAFAGTSGTIATTIDFQAHDVHAPLWFVSFYLWRQVFGDGEVISRVYSVFLSLITLSLVHRIARRWFGEAWKAHCAVTALGLLSYFFLYGIEIRPYALVMLVSALSMWTFERWLVLQTLRSAILYGLTVAAMLYLHYFGTFLILMQGVYFLAQNARLHGTRINQWRQPIVQAIVGLGLAFVLWLPWFPTFVSQVRHIGQLVTASEARVVQGVGMASTTQRTDAATLTRLINLCTNMLPLVFTVILLVGLFRLWRHSRYWLAFAWGIGVPVSMLAVNLIVPVYEPRYASTLVPGIGLLIGISLAECIPLAPFIHRKNWIARLAPVIPLGAFCLVAVNISSGVTSVIPHREILEQAQAEFQAGDGVYLDNIPYELTNTYLYSHYAPSLFTALKDRSQNVTVNPNAVRGDATSPRCVWFVTKSWFTDPKTREIFSAIERARPLQHVIGIQDRLLIQQLCGAPDVTPIQFGESIRLRGIDVLSATRNEVKLKLWWDALAAPTLEYSISVKLLDAQGISIIQSDGPIQDFYGRGTLPTTTLQPHEYTIDARTLTGSLAAGEYQIAVSVYQWWDMKMLPVSGADNRNGLAMVRTVTIP